MNPDLVARLKKLIAQQDTTKNPEFASALADEGARRARLFIQGIKTYQRHPVRRHEVIAPVLIQIGAMRLRDYNPFNPLAPVILVIPSLINRFDIMDLDPKTSFLQSLAATGFRPIVIDWGVPGEAEKNFSLSDYILKLVIPALRFAQRCHPSAPAVHVMGYCMGGLLALALAQFCPESVRSLTLLATPWDFHQPTKAIGKSFSQLASDVGPLLQQLGYLPVDYIQMLFASLQPLEVITKFSKFGALNPESLEAQQFVILEDWLNDGVPLTAPVARACMQDWYGDNATARFAWQIGGNIIDPRSIDVPAYVVVPGRDRIVPPEAARPLAELLPQATLVEPMTGHVGMMTSRTSSNRIWMPLIDWLKKH